MEPEVGTGVITKPLIAFDIATTALMLAAALYATQIPALGRGFPLCISCGAAIVALAVLALHLWRYHTQTRDASVAEPPDATLEAAQVAQESEGVQRPSFARVVGVFGWLVGYALLIWIIGLLPAALVFLFLFLRMESKASITVSVISAVVVTVALSMLSDALGMAAPPTLFDIPTIPSIL
jgi:Tripartite tricarboxylate transporter TctB family